MVYNRYIPDSNGVYRQQKVISQDKTGEQLHCVEPKVDAPVKISDDRQTPTIDLGDVLLLCIVILLILEADGDDMTSVIIAIAAFIFLQ